ncbi:hypothetical protein EDD37DRAFT_568323 [Exophiala viscosa]|uniref:Ketoreductase domain-containing protein n=1 Tax=Exophiala viscosa TaxID=2486360 RepID=A0AAN6DZV1_9EURO|nr:hypothetical protein EDD36DRAFT_382036 [Exophiala viscosa]KAI1621284.1 hypothetical protein EDD37DRAFT_568323 [Exophiala viscosa]
MFEVRGKTVVITGGARGLGLHFAQCLAQFGANIAVIDLASKPSEAFLELQGKGGNHKYYQADVTDYDGLKSTIDTIANDFGSINGCIPAAGIIRDKPFLEHSKSDIDSTLAVNLNAVFYTVQHCAAKMKEQKSGGSIICIASTASHQSLWPQTITAYTASKFGVRGFTKQAAAELAQYNIRVNSISPGCMMTDMLQSVITGDESRRKLFEDNCVMHRIAKPSELNGIVVYLMSDASSYATAADYRVDGGVL